MHQSRATDAAESGDDESSAPAGALRTSGKTVVGGSAGERLFSLAGLAILLLFAGLHLSKTLNRTWFLSSDEYVFAAEVIRFVNLDFHQRFFDIPGTPFMLLNAAVWAVWYAILSLGGTAAASLGIDEFTFQHLPSLFVLMRSMTVLWFLVSAVLTYMLAARLIGRTAGLLAAILLLMSPTYAAYSSFVRTESLALVLSLTGAVILRAGLDGDRAWLNQRPGRRDPALLAGIFAGLAAGARLHAVSAILPALTLMLWIENPRETAYPDWVRRSVRVLLPTTMAVAVAAVILARKEIVDAPGAQRFVINVAAAWLAFGAGSTVLYAVRRTRPMVVRFVSPAVLKLGTGAVAGLLAGNFTMITQFRYFLDSVQMYSNYLDRDRMQWTLWQNLSWYVHHYIDIAAPDRVVFWLLITGAVLILVRRDRRVLPFALVSLLFFVSKPLNLVAAPHHIIPWLPYFFIVCAYPIAWVASAIAGTGRRRLLLAQVSAAAAVIVVALSVTRGPVVAISQAMSQEPRLRNIERATAWIKQHTPRGSLVAVSYFCFNPDTFYSWMRALAVPVPPSVSDGREYLIWWGGQSAIRDREGYACATRDDVVSIKDKMDLATPGEGTDPYTDRRFKLVESFGTGTAEVDLFHFTAPLGIDDDAAVTSQAATP